MRTFGFWNELEQRLSSGVVRISELNGDLRRGLGGLIYVNLNLRNREVWKRFQSILNRIGVFICQHGGHIDLDRTGVILASKLVDKTQLKESYFDTALKIASQRLLVRAAIGLAVGFGIVTFRALAQ